MATPFSENGKIFGFQGNEQEEIKVFYETIIPILQAKAKRLFPYSLPIPFRSIVCFAEHLTIFAISCTTLAPSCDMIRIHIGKSPYLALVCIVSHGTVRTI